MISVEEAVAATLAGVEPLAGIETLAIPDAIERVLATDLHADRDQPPFPASAMDGYAVRASDAKAGAILRLVDESRAGHAAQRSLGEGEAIRIFTGAPVPEGADAILIQENARADGDRIFVEKEVEPGRYLRPRGFDIAAGSIVGVAGTVVDAGLATLLATTGLARVPVRTRPIVAIVATGDELVPLGETPGPAQIVASSPYGVGALLASAGATTYQAGIAADTKASLHETFDRAEARGAVLVVTLGGASVGDHDLVAPVLRERGVEMAFEKVAMRPGKPLMHGRDGQRLYLGLPGNPVSSLVCARVFGQPLVAKLAGRPHAHDWRIGRLGRDLAENDEREEFMRAHVHSDEDGAIVTPFDRQDSSLVATYAAAEALVHRPARAAAARAGNPCRYIPLRPSPIRHAERLRSGSEPA